MEEQIELAKDAISHAKINQDLWIENGNNREFKPGIQVYENGFKVFMWHTASAPQCQWVRVILVNGQTELGNFIGGHTFNHFISDEDMEQYNLTRVAQYNVGYWSRCNN